MTFRRLRKFFRRRYRDIFATSITGTTAAQIRSMREKEGWSQEELAQKTGMGQARISLLENPNYQNLSLKTLKRIANVFDVALVVRFEPFSRLFAIIDSETSKTLAVRSFVEEFGTEANPITTPAEKVVDLAKHLGMLQRGAMIEQHAHEAQQQGSGASLDIVVARPTNVGALANVMDKYHQVAVGQEWRKM
jgi:transcriptional regulator with XRE-family HTH domain